MGWVAIIRKKKWPAAGKRWNSKGGERKVKHLFRLLFLFLSQIYRQQQKKDLRQSRRRRRRRKTNGSQSAKFNIFNDFFLKKLLFPKLESVVEFLNSKWQKCRNFLANLSVRPPPSPRPCLQWVRPTCRRYDEEGRDGGGGKRDPQNWNKKEIMGPRKGNFLFLGGRVFWALMTCLFVCSDIR